jgi:hypothetical protein
MAPDWATILTRAVPRLDGVALPYPPQPPRVSESPTMARTAAAASRGGRAFRKLSRRSRLALHLAPAEQLLKLFAGPMCLRF